ncbi:Bacteriophage head-tail adaptor [Thalassovita gelatinovora]|uniref:Bacteriophage head-tail adaptor n=1 Tax=Thalassovita gelatinovora TaxID=53501 RepID=A0A0P1FSM3_THAGE|nr:head-tail adaptor protein [Thalassovita gelatinovora]QIZ79541.1 head-tail adaptor protein [Thalassovita gelatinovora]CUH62997.1 Bacteriophage head-tail adaptor [Thalassovita gelatinovora]SEQ13851.1 head-tail adaptor [Thalassovita gelatinovora]
MTPPRLTRLLALETADRVADGAGGFAESWTVLGQLWAEVTLRSGRESGGLSKSRFRIVVRATPQGSTMRPRPDQRFRDGDRVFRIEAVSERDPEGRYLTCFATEEVVS